MEAPTRRDREPPRDASNVAGIPSIRGPLIAASHRVSRAPIRHPLASSLHPPQGRTCRMMVRLGCGRAHQTGSDGARRMSASVL